MEDSDEPAFENPERGCRALVIRGEDPCSRQSLGRIDLPSCGYRPTPSTKGSHWCDLPFWVPYQRAIGSQALSGPFPGPDKASQSPELRRLVALTGPPKARDLPTTRLGKGTVKWQ